MTSFGRIAIILFLLGTASFAGAQQASPPASNSSPSAATSSPTPTQPPQTAPTKPQSSEDVLKQEEKQRAFGVVPMFSMTNVKDAPPLTSRQKFHLMARTMIDPFTFLSAGLTAGIGQANNSFPGYGQGAEGFGKRYGAALADNADSNFFSNFFYPVLFKQDPRYFRTGQGSITRRTWSAVEQEFVARQDSGRHMFSFSNVLGAFTAGTISNAYYPESDRGVGLTFSRASIALGYGCLGNIFLEFWPDIDQKLFHKKENPNHPSEPPGTSPK